MKIKKISDNHQVVSDEITGEPIANVHVQSKQYGKEKTYVAKWHPHMMALHPKETGDINNNIDIGNTADNIVYAVGRAHANLHKKHEFDVRIEPDPVMIKGKYDSEPKAHAIFHLHDRETGAKVLSLKTPKYEFHSALHGESKLKVHEHHIGTPENLTAAQKLARGGKKEGYDGESLSHYVDLAHHLKRMVSTGGPRFTGHTKSANSGSTHRYKTSIADPRAAIDAFVETAIPNHKELNVIKSGNMSILHSSNGREHHIVTHRDGEIHHSQTNVDSTESTNQKIYEKVE